MKLIYSSITTLLVCLFCSCGKVPTPEPNQSFTHYNGDFEIGNISGFHYLVPDTSVNTVVVSSPVRKGNYALKNTLRPDDYINNGYRAEFAMYDCAKYKTEVYYAFSFLIDTNYSDYAYNLICQWQDLPYYLQGETWEPSPTLRGSSPPLALVYVDGNLEIKMNENPSSDANTFLVGNSLPITKGIWYDVMAHIYWSDEEDAYIEIFINGNPITPSNGTDFKFYNKNIYNRTGNYFKFGQYRGKDNPESTNIIYFDEVKVGSTLLEVAL